VIGDEPDNAEQDTGTSDQAVSKGEERAGYRFYQLYDKVYREDILTMPTNWREPTRERRGWMGRAFEDIESRGLGEWLNGLREELRNKTYQPQPVRRVMIPKPGGGERPLGIPTIRDRVAQTAAKLILEPIFEADLEPNAYGYRPKRRVRRMPSGKWMNCCTRGTRMS
jgi:RNA-directed DNA polymerase